MVKIQPINWLLLYFILHSGLFPSADLKYYLPTLEFKQNYTSIKLAVTIVYPYPTIDQESNALSRLSIETYVPMSKLQAFKVMEISSGNTQSP